MRIDATSAGTFGGTDTQTQQHADAPAYEPKAESRALVVITAPAAKEAKPDQPMAYRDAPFLAQLIATKDKLPQTRNRRRAEPAEALAAYRNAAKLIA